MKPSEYGGWPGMLTTYLTMTRANTRFFAGPDGEPDTICNWGDSPSCDLAEECVDGTVEIEEQDTVS